MELLQFRYFLEAAKHGNLTKAAEGLHIAQPALSQSIRRLENELGVPLFDRKNHRIYLNEQGKLLEKRLIPLMGSFDNLKYELWESVCSSEKTIYLNFYAASTFITNCIIAYRKIHPDVKFQVSQLEMTAACDIHIDSRSAMRKEEGNEKDLLPEGAIGQRVLKEQIFLAVPTGSELAQKKSVDLRELREEGYIRLLHRLWLAGRRSLQGAAGYSGNVLSGGLRRCETGFHFFPAIKKTLIVFGTSVLDSLRKNGYNRLQKVTF